MDNMEEEIVSENPSVASMRFPVTQEQIDDILANELKDFTFPVRPVYNPHIKDNGRAIAEVYKWGELKRIKTIEIGKQDIPGRLFLTGTLLHEYYEAEIMKRQYAEDFYKKLYKSADENRHKWINAQIQKFFKGMEGTK